MIVQLRKPRGERTQKLAREIPAPVAVVAIALVCVTIAYVELKATGPREDPNEGKSVAEKVELLREAQERYMHYHPDHASAFQLFIQSGEKMVQGDQKQ
jgi:hypothetical protein